MSHVSTPTSYNRKASCRLPATLLVIILVIYLNDLPCTGEGNYVHVYVCFNARRRAHVHTDEQRVDIVPFTAPRPLLTETVGLYVHFGDPSFKTGPFLT